MSVLRGWAWARAAIAVIAMVLVALAVSACGDDEESSSGGDTAAAEEDASQEPVKIGAVLAQSGLFSQYDISNTIGVKMAADAINADGGVLDGRQLELEIGDYKSKPPQGGAIARQLIDDGAGFIITSADFDFGSPAALAAQSKGVPAMSAGAEVPEFGIEGIGPLAFTMGTATAETAAVWAEWMHNEKGFDSVYMLEDPTIAYDTSLCTNFETAWTELVGADSIVGKDTFENPDPSIDAQISRLKALPEPPDFITLCSYPPGGATAVRQLRAAGIDTPIIAGDAFSGSGWLKAAGNLSDFFYTDYVSVYGDDPNDEVNELIAAAKEQVDDPNSIVGVMVSAYSAVEAYAQAVTEAGSTEPEAVVQALEAFDGVELLVGPTSFSPDSHINTTRPLTILEIQDGEGRFVERYTPESVPPIEIK